MRTRELIVGVALMLVAGAGCADKAGSDDAAVSFAGAVEGEPGTLVGVVTEGDEVVAYVCDGVTGQWYSGTLEDDGGASTLTAIGEDGTLTVDVDDESVSGTVDGDAFSAPVAEGDGGIWFADLDGPDAGEESIAWVYVDATTQTGAVRPSGTAPRLVPSSGEVDFDGVTASAVRVTTPSFIGQDIDL
jgi:hypothetical protein